MTLVACVERLHAEGYVVLGPANAEDTAQLLGLIAFPEGEIPDPARVQARARSVLAAFPERATT